jgi:hypothetical protein
MSTNFEEKLYKQQAYWVSELSIDGLVPSVFMQLIANPNTNEYECDVIFREAKNISVNYDGGSDNEKSKYLCMLLGIDDSTDNGITKYTITTDTVEFVFYTAIEPEIRWYNPKNPFQKWRKEVIKVNK